MTVSAETDFLSALLKSNSIDTKRLDIINDNARLPSEELIVRLGLDYHNSSFTTVSEEGESIYSMHDDCSFMASTEFDLPILKLDVLVGDARWGETKKEESSLGCVPIRSPTVENVAQARRRPQRSLPRSLCKIPYAPISCSRFL